jgi:hypothetical protein
VHFLRPCLSPASRRSSHFMMTPLFSVANLKKVVTHLLFRLPLPPSSVIITVLTTDEHLGRSCDEVVGFRSEAAR